MCPGAESTSKSPEHPRVAKRGGNLQTVSSYAAGMRPKRNPNRPQTLKPLDRTTRNLPYRKGGIPKTKFRFPAAAPNTKIPSENLFRAIGLQGGRGWALRRYEEEGGFLAQAGITQRRGGRPTARSRHASLKSSGVDEKGAGPAAVA